MSAPMIDSVGNVWFVGSYERAAQPGATRNGLFRAVLQPATFSYKLELVLSQGDVLPGRNSGRNYLVEFITLNDSNSIGSGTAWSGNIAEVAHLAQAPAGLSTSDSRTLGGLVLNVSLVYDRDGDGMFVPSTGTGGTAGSPDEDYEALLYVAASNDCNLNGIPDDKDIFDGTVQDGNMDGIPDVCQGSLGTLYCFGDGSGTACPCGNASAVGANDGCLNSFGLAGRLRASGVPSLATDNVVLAGSQMPNAPALYFQGTQRVNAGAGALFGDGLRCAGGQVVRLKQITNAGGGSQYPQAGDPPVSVRGLVTAPGLRMYQVWYRNSAPFCTPDGWNLTNAVEINWLP
jgi:hypothetical protein